MCHGSRQHCCHSNPTFRKFSWIITQRMAEHFKVNPYVTGWQTDNEINCHFSECHCKSCEKEFQKFLKQHPKTPDSGSAQFWIAETWYVDDRYEKAIVEYEKVIKGFPTSEKVPHALLKQGMSFQKLGDDGSAKIVHQQITKKYPQTQQAKVARVRLSELK